MFQFTQTTWQSADKSQLVAEVRPLEPFDRVCMNDYGDLFITQGDTPSLTVTAHPDVLPRIKTNAAAGRLTMGFGSWLDKLGEAFTTSMTRKHIRYDLTVTDLKVLEVYAMARLRIGALETDQFQLRLCGAVGGRVEALQTEQLIVSLECGVQLEISGEARIQQITMKGAGDYRAAGLMSRAASVSLHGASYAEVWATDSLDVDIQGIGRVGYCGSPALTRRISGQGTVSALGI